MASKPGLWPGEDSVKSNPYDSRTGVVTISEAKQEIQTRVPWQSSG